MNMKQGLGPEIERARQPQTPAMLCTHKNTSFRLPLPLSFYRIIRNRFCLLCCNCICKLASSWSNFFPKSCCVLILACAATVTIHAQSPLPDSFNPGPNSQILAAVVQPDSEILAGGYFTSIGGQGRTLIGRLDPNGTLDAAFNAGPTSPTFPLFDAAYAMALQTNGQVILGGAFTNVGGLSRKYICRLSTNGTVDASFDPAIAGYWVDSLAFDTNGAILVGGWFTNLAGQPRPSLGRLNADGSLDSTFNPQIAGSNNLVNSVVLQPDGKILVGGFFSMMVATNSVCIRRFNADGTLDGSFAPSVTGGDNPSEVFSIAVQPDGKVLVAGRFYALNGQSRTNIGRFNSDGTLDTSFNPGAGKASGQFEFAELYSLALQANGRILVGGHFAELGGVSRTNFGCVMADGSPDLAFDPQVGSPGAVTCIAVQADGRTLFGGDFTVVGGQARTNVARLNDVLVASQNLSFDGTTVTWLRGGGSPEVWRVSFDFSTNSTDWVNIGAGTRTSGGWQISGSTWPASAIVRARGFVPGGGNSSWFVETNFSLAMAAPALGVAATGKNIIISWPETATNYTLQSSSDLSPTASWGFVTNVPGTNASRLSVALPFSQAQQYFRLQSH
jgi:uncharacterized delta-60 repeat protein